MCYTPSMDFKNYTIKATEAIQEAAEIASSYGQQAIDIPHLLLALIRQKDGFVPALFSGLEIDTQTLAATLESDLAARPKISGDTQGISLTQDLNRVLTEAQTQMKKL